jgi:hypothetical protein
MTGGTTWYLSDDCLLAAKRAFYAVEYRRFYLRDLESIVVWPSRRWLLRPIIPAVFFVSLGAALWHWVNVTSGAFAGGVGVAWAALELALGPTANSHIRTEGATVHLPLVKRTRRASQVLAKIDAALRTARGSESQPNASPAETLSAPLSGRPASDSTPAAASLGDMT